MTALSYYKVAKIGTGTFADPFRPDGMSGLTWGQDVQMADGSFLLHSGGLPASGTAQSLGSTLTGAEETLGVSEISTS
jgi:hypothetical protein